MFQVEGKMYSVDFYREIVPVNYYHKGKLCTANRMQTTCILLDDQGITIDTGSVRQNHKDPYNRKIANDKAFKRMAESRPDGKALLMAYFNRTKHNDKSTSIR